MQIPDTFPLSRCLADTFCMVEAVKQLSNTKNSQQQLEQIIFLSIKLHRLELCTKIPQHNFV